MSIYYNDPYYFSKAIATVAVVGQVLGVLAIVSLFVRNRWTDRYLAYLHARSTKLALIVAVVAVCSSLLFSDFFKMSPCKLCWYQRIFIFSQLVILIVAMLKKHHDHITTYCIALASICIPISIFHYALQMTDAPAVHAFAPCNVTGQAPSCSGFYVLIYGYMTIPLMALTTSTLILLLMVIRERGR